MAKDRDSRRKGLLTEAVDPVSGKHLSVQISHERLQFMKQLGLRALKETAFLVPLVLRRPTAIFEGLSRESDEERGRGYGWRCYVGRPEHSYRTDGTEAPAWPDQLFLVFVNEEKVAYNWRWERCDPDKPKLPEGYADRFRQRVL